MNSGKLKLLLIILFLAVDLFFLHKIITIRNVENTFTDAEITSAIQLVSSKGVNISSDIIPKEKNPPKTLKLDWDIELIELAAKQILNSEYGSFKIPNGHSFTSDTEKFTVFQDYSFEYSSLNNTESIESVGNALNDATTYDEKAVENYEKSLKKLTKITEDKNFKVLAKIEKYAKSNEREYIYVTQYVNGCKVDGAGFVAVFENGTMIFSIGTFYFSGNVNSYSTNAHDSINILFELEASENEIINTQRQYFPVRENENSVYLTPSYRFTYDNGVSVLYDATSGKIRK